MNVIFHPLAQQELSQTMEFYEHQVPGLGNIFFEEISDAVDRIKLYPESYHIIMNRTRKCSLQKFPYLVLYGIIHDTIVVSAIAHQHRHPRSYLR